MFVAAKAKLVHSTRVLRGCKASDGMHVWSEPFPKVPEMWQLSHAANIVYCKLPLKETSELTERCNDMHEQLCDKRAECLIETIVRVSHRHTENRGRLKEVHCHQPRYAATALEAYKTRHT